MGSLVRQTTKVVGSAQKETVSAMSTFEILFPDYVRNVRCNAYSTSVLRARLEHAAPKDLTPIERKALRPVIQAADDVAAVQAERDRLSSGKLRPLLTTFITAWSAMYDALSAAARVTPPTGDEPPREQVILGSLFPDGIAFTQLDAESAWAEGNRRLERTHDEGLEEPLVEIIGKKFVAAVKKATGALAEAIGTGRSARNKPIAGGLQESLTRFGRAVGAYGRALAADCDESDPAQVERFLHAMAPVDQHRANVRAHSSAGDVTAPDTTDVAANDAPTSASPPVPVSAVPVSTVPVSTVPAPTPTPAPTPIAASPTPPAQPLAA